MKNLLLLTTLCTAFGCQAAEPDAAPLAAETAPAAPAPIKLPPGRCPTMPRPQMLPLNITGNFLYVARFTLKADGRLDGIHVEGRGPKELAKSIANSIGGFRCLPADADQEIAMEFRFKIE
ncbi:MAG TPA: hypothetical protein VIN03_17290 [Roseateles sp.]